MGQAKNHNKRINNYHTGDSSSGQTYLSLPLRTISSMIIVFAVAFLASCVTASIATPVQNSSADTVTTNIDNSGYYVNVTSHNVSLDLVTTPDGATVVDKDTVTTETNSPTGFKLYISTNSTNSTSNRMVNSTDSSYYLPTVSGTTNSPVKLSMNTWGYSLTSLTQNGGSASNPSAGSVTASSYFIGMPVLDNENLIQTVSSPAPTGSGASIDVYFGARANTTLPSGSYISTIVYTVLAEGSPASNGEVSVSPDYSTMNGGGTLTIATGVYTNANDLGTITVSVGGETCTNSTATRTGTNGSINVTCTLPNLSSQSVGWKQVTVNMIKFGKSYTIAEGVQYYIPWANMTEMQQMTAKACELAPESTASNYTTNQKVLTDNRDGYTYTVRKLKDGNCWMTENLRLTFQNGKALHSNGTTLTTLTSQNSDFTTISSWDGGGHTTETASNHTVWYSNNNENPNNLPGSYTFGNEKSTNDDVSQYKGAVYNWFVATAGKGLSSLPAYSVANDSICPKGWQLPFAGHANAPKSMGQLINYAGSNSNAIAWNATLRTAPYSFIRNGYYNGSIGITTSDDDGFAWTASLDGNSQPIRLYLSQQASVYFGGALRGYGFPIRCVSR